MQTLNVEAHVGADGHLRVDVPVELPPGSLRAVLVVDDTGIAEGHPMETALLSQNALAEEWDRPEEEKAWKHLQSAMSS